MWLLEYFFLNSANLMCRGTDISKYLIESLGIRDNESRLYNNIDMMKCLFPDRMMKVYATSSLPAHAFCITSHERRCNEMLALLR